MLIYQGTNLYMEAIEQGRIEAARPKRKPLIKRKHPGKRQTERQTEKRREKDFERRGRNIYKFRKRGRSR